MTAAVTIAMPVYNAASLLGEALENVAGQSFRAFEVVIYDNASTDNTLSIAQAFSRKDDRFRVVARPENIGILNNFEAGLVEAQSPYFLWRAYDDLTDPGWLQSLFDLLEANADADLAVGAHEMIRVKSGRVRFTSAPEFLPRGRAQRAVKLLANARSGWFYGLHRRVSIARLWSQARRAYGYTWGIDFATLAPILLKGAVVGTNAATFRQRIVSGEMAYEAPRTLDERMGMARRYFAITNAAIAGAGYNRLERLWLKAAVVKQTNRRLVKLAPLALPLLANRSAGKNA